MIKVLPVVYRDQCFTTQSFAFGGEEGPDAFDASQRYRSGELASFPNAEVWVSENELGVDELQAAKEKFNAA